MIVAIIRYCDNYKPSVVETVKLNIKYVIINHLHGIDI